MNLFDSASLVVTPNAYKTSKLYSIVPSDGTGDMTFSRTGDTATRVNSSGLIESVLANKPRLDYLGSTCPRLLVEPQRTNIFTYSEQFDNASWTKVNSSITTNTINSPMGTLTADSLIENSIDDNHGMYQTASLTSGSAYTISFFVKANTRNFCRINFLAVNSVFTASSVWFDLSNGTIGTTNSGITASIDNYQNGWYRIKATRTAAATATGYIGLYASTANNITNYLGNGTSGIYIWGAQLEAGSFATSYIPTTTASVTRNNEFMSKTSASSLIGATEGTLFTDVIINQFYSFGTLLNLSNGTSNEYIQIITNSSREIKAEVKSVTNGGIQATITLTNNIAGNRFKVAFAYKQNDFVMYVNGVQIGTDTSGLLPVSLSRIDYDINGYSLGSQSILGINSSALWKTRLTNSELATLTTI